MRGSSVRGQRVDRFEDLVAWQKARELTREIYAVTRSEAFRRDFGLSGQMQRAAVSIMSNLAEGYERGSSAQFHHFVCIAKASCAELRSQLYIARDIQCLDETSFQALHGKAEEVARLTGGLRVSLERQMKS